MTEAGLTPQQLREEVQRALRGNMGEAGEGTPHAESGHARIEQMVRDHVGGASADYVGHGVKFANRVFTERGLFALLFVGLMCWNLRASYVANEALGAQNKQLATTVKALAYQSEEQGELFEEMNATLEKMTRELHDANLVRRYSAPQFRPNPFQNPQEQTNGRLQR